jgi:hypothetical protein
MFRLLRMLSLRKRPSAYKITMERGHNFLYREGDRKLLIHGEMLTGDLDFVVYSGGITNWLPPYQEEAVGVEKKQQILSRLDRYMKQYGIRYELEG